MVDPNGPYVIVTKQTSIPIMEAGRAKIFGEPGDAHWFISQRFGQGAVVNYDVIPLSEFLSSDSPPTDPEETPEPEGGPEEVAIPASEPPAGASGEAANA